MSRTKHAKSTRGRRVLIGGAASVIALVALGFMFLRAPTPVRAEQVHVYKSATCTCCEKWIEHMRKAGFQVDAENVPSTTRIKQRYGVDHRLESCHTAVVGGYVVEGHVPAKAVIRMLDERPAIAGIAAPGMPLGAPGMESSVREPFNVIAFTKTGEVSLFASVR